jgi:hypothetical protein
MAVTTKRSVFMKTSIGTYALDGTTASAAADRISYAVSRNAYSKNVSFKNFSSSCCSYLAKVSVHSFLHEESIFLYKFELRSIYLRLLERDGKCKVSRLKFKGLHTSKIIKFLLCILYFRYFNKNILCVLTYVLGTSEFLSSM